MTYAHHYTLANGNNIPAIGFGTFKITDAKECIQSVKDAIACGYTTLILLRPMTMKNS